jgi:4-hydroxythreonine-4-phosphate dehydrogenase
LKPIGITMGDPAGVGPEVLLKALTRLGGAIPVRVFGDRGVLGRCAARLAAELPLELDEISLLPEDLPTGRFSPEGGQAQLAYLEAATAALTGGQIAALVTGPIHKQALRLKGEGPGQTEWLGRRLGVARPVMMLMGPRLKVVLATAHLPLREVAAALRRELLVDIVRIAAADLRRYFHPGGATLALAALNPHGEEDGLPGREELQILAPAVAELRALGLDVSGPVPADSVFFQAAGGRYHAVVAMYHDQGLAPLKTLHFDSAVNVTLGLGVVRTSPDHGVAYDLAGQDRANPGSMEAAIRLAAGMVREP